MSDRDRTHAIPWRELYILTPSLIYPLMFFVFFAAGDSCRVYKWPSADSPPPLVWPLYVVDGLLILHFELLMLVHRKSKEADVTALILLQVLGGLCLWCLIRLFYMVAEYTYL